jgi:murein DD-endopeptidase MepM/ murein hydrolase activator NlpD
MISMVSFAAIGVGLGRQIMRPTPRLLGLILVIMLLMTQSASGKRLAGNPRSGPAVEVVGGSSVVGAGTRAFLDATVHSRWCRVELASGSNVSSGRAQRVRGSLVRLAWTVPKAAISGAYSVTLRCAASRKAVPTGTAATLPISVDGGEGTLPILNLKTARIRRLSRHNAREHFRLTRRLPPGVGDPSTFSVAGPANAGGAAFSTYWPLAQGAKTQITEGPGGSFSHDTVYTQNAVDLGVPTGTEIHAGFTGVVARINSGCVAGDYLCGDGFGNYLYLKATDGTCAVMAHLSQLNVTPGQQIQQYEVIGLSGATGDVTGPHLHYDHIDCTTNHSLPWTPIEGGSLAEGTTITSQDHPPTQPCLALQGGCGPSPQPTTSPQPGTSPPIQGEEPNHGGGTPPAPPSPSISASRGGPDRGGYDLNIQLHNFPTGTFTYYCHDNSGPGGSDTVFYENAVTVTDPNQGSWPGVFCYDSAPYVAYLVMNNVISNSVQF